MFLMPRNNSRKKKTSWLRQTLIFSIITLSLIGCRDQSQVKGLVVNLEFSDRTLTDNLVTRLKAKFITTSGYQGLNQDYNLVAVAEWQGREVLREYLKTSVPISKWSASRVYEVTEYLYIPPLINIFEPKTPRGIEIIFRLMLEKSDLTESLILYSRSLQVQPCPVDVPDVVLLDGWEKIKRFPANLESPSYELWTGQKAICLLKNPGRPGILLLDGENAQQEGVGVSLFLGEKRLDELVLPPGKFKKFYSLTVANLGSEPELKLIILVDKTLRLGQIYPGVEDEREVGLKINKIYFR